VDERDLGRVEAIRRARRRWSAGASAHGPPPDRSSGGGADRADLGDGDRSDPQDGLGCSPERLAPPTTTGPRTTLPYIQENIVYIGLGTLLLIIILIVIFL
jgi:hypothetical protein